MIRLDFDSLAPRLQQLLGARVRRLGYLGEFFRIAGHQPDILTPFLEMTDALKAALPDRLTEVGALTVARLMLNDYERNQHEQLSRAMGFDDGWIAAVEQLTPELAPELTAAERAVQHLVIAAVERRGTGVNDELTAVIEAVGDEQAIALLFLIGRYMTHAIIVNALGLAAPVPSIFAAAAE